MKYFITESKLNSVMTRFLDDYLSKYEVIETKDIIGWGSGEGNQMVYDKDMELLFVSVSVYELIKNMFDIDHHDYVEFIKSYMANKGYYVHRIV